MKERDFLNWVMDVARRTGWKVWHVPAPMVHDRKRGFVATSAGAGLPDLIMLHSDPATLVFAEVKGENGKLTDAQREFLRMAREVGRQDDIIPSGVPVAAYLWVPGMEESIERVLKTRVLA